ncbi:MAG: hypothetical protein M3Z05_18795 [Gemmatimonadota bacterium]|nr:hypothetical protein [Gemmatimonadota bacterium]
MKKRFDVFYPVALLIVATTLVAACGPAPAPQAPSVEPEAGAPAMGCGSACTNLRSLHCSLGEPTKKGASCEVVCDNVQVNNAGAGFPVACLTHAKSCDAANACR